MSTIERVNRFISQALNVDQEVLTSESTLASLILRAKGMTSTLPANHEGSLVEGIGSETLWRVEVAICLEEEFDLEIPDSEASMLMPQLMDPKLTIKDMVEFIETYRRK